MILRFKIFGDFTDQMIAGTTTRQWGGNFKEDQPQFEPSIARLRQELDLAEPVTSYQVHGDTVLILKTPPRALPTGDALVTQTKNLPLMVKVADCQGVLIFDPKTHAIAAVHSGWRGSVQNIIGKTIQKMAEMRCDPADLRVAVSPSLGPCCAEFTDPARELPPTLHPFIHGKHVDFWAVTQAQCLSAGVLGHHLELTRECTRCHPERYFSHRNGDPERMGVFIVILNPTLVG